MGWRNHTNNREETKAVKAALIAANVPFVTVRHGRGTASSWLEINLGRHEFDTVTALRGRAIKVAQDATGRHGDYNGNILVLAQ